MNKVILAGRLVKDPEAKYTQMVRYILDLLWR